MGTGQARGRAAAHRHNTGAQARHRHTAGAQGRAGDTTGDTHRHTPFSARPAHTRGDDLLQGEQQGVHKECTPTRRGGILVSDAAFLYLHERQRGQQKVLLLLNPLRLWVRYGHGYEGQSALKEDAQQDEQQSRVVLKNATHTSAAGGES